MQNPNEKSQSNKPIFMLVLTSKENKKRRTVAGAVFDAKYNMNLRLNPGIVIDSHVAETCWINLVPYANWEKPKTDEYPPRREADFDGAPIDAEDDLPF